MHERPMLIPAAGFSIFATAAFFFLCFTPAYTAEEEEELVNANLSSITDSLGFQWKFDDSGGFRSGYLTFEAMQVNGNRFDSNQPKMTKDGSEYVLKDSLGSLQVTRRILMDKDRSAARYLEVFHNPTGSPKKVQARISVDYRISGPPMKAFTNSGGSVSGKLGKKDTGFVVGFQQPGRSFGSSTRVGDLAWLVAGLRNKNKPAVVLGNNMEPTVKYSFSVKPKKTVSLVHYAIQRNNITRANVGSVFEEFYKRGRLIKPKVPSDLRGSVLNFNMFTLLEGIHVSGHAMAPIRNLAKSLGVERGSADILHMTDGTHISGSAECNRLEITSALGNTTVEIQDVAALIGGARRGRPMRCYLRNGEILAGEIEAEGLKLITESGLNFSLPPENIDALIMHKSKKDGVLPPEATAFLTTANGDRLVLCETDKVPLRLLTPWGTIQVELGKKDRFFSFRDIQPHYGLALENGTRISVIPQNRTIELHTCRFGKTELPSLNLAGLAWIKEEKKKEKKEEPSCESITLGKLDSETRKKLSAVKVGTLTFFNTPATEIKAKLQEIMKVPLSFPEELKEEMGKRKLNIVFTETMNGEQALEEFLNRINLIAARKEDKIILKAPSKEKKEDKDKEDKDKEDKDKEDKDKEGEEKEPESTETGKPKGIKESHWKLTGENTVVGKLSRPHLNVVSEVGPARIKFSRIVSINRKDAESPQVPYFNFKLENGEELTGTLKEHLLPVDTGKGSLTIPVAHVISYKRGVVSEAKGKHEKKKTAEDNGGKAGSGKPTDTGKSDQTAPDKSD